MGIEIMKKNIVTICIMMMCSICLVPLTGIVYSQQAGYTIVEYEGMDIPMIDGTYSAGYEWTDSEERQLDGNLNAVFRIKNDRELITSAIINHYILIEFFDDTTNDAGDYVQLCLAVSGSVGGTPTGGTTPQTDCLRFDYNGNTASGFTFYRGDGSTWVEGSADLGSEIVIASSFGASPSSATPHLIVEVLIQAAAFDIDPEIWLRVAVYDASNSGAGVQAWPTSSVDVPNEWGLVNTLDEVIPEFASWMILPMVVMASLAIIIVRKRLTKSETRT
jgi:hypothetical protein